MTRIYLWYVIVTGQGYWLDDKGVLLECHWVDDKRLILASHCYAKIVARELEVLTSYVGQLNLTVTMFGMVLE